MAHSALATLLCSCGSTGCAGCGTSCVLISWQLHRHVGSEAATAAAQMDTNGRTSMDILHHAPVISVLIQSHSFLSSVHVVQSSSHVFVCVFSNCDWHVCELQQGNASPDGSMSPPSFQCSSGATQAVQGAVEYQEPGAELQESRQAVHCFQLMASIYRM